MQLSRVGFLVLLWLFVLGALRVVRSDLFAASGVRAAVPRVRRPRPRDNGPRDNSPRDNAARERGQQRSPQRARQGTIRQLVVTGGPLTGTRVTLDGRPILIGRADDSTLVLDDDYASSRHARLGQADGHWYVEDLGSTNGTYLDRAKVTAPTRVNRGTPIRIGTTVIELQS